MPNVMAALPNISGAVCSMPQSLADAHYYTVGHKKEPTCFVCNFVKNQQILLQISLLDLKVIGTCDV